MLNYFEIGIPSGFFCYIYIVNKFLEKKKLVVESRVGGHDPPLDPRLLPEYFLTLNPGSQGSVREKTYFMLRHSHFPSI
jgi:hypothetical protein